MTDGVSTSIRFAHREVVPIQTEEQKKVKQKAQRDEAKGIYQKRPAKLVDDILLQEVQSLPAKSFRIIGVDPGRINVLSAMYDEPKSNYGEYTNRDVMRKWFKERRGLLSDKDWYEDPPPSDINTRSLLPHRSANDNMDSRFIRLTGNEIRHRAHITRDKHVLKLMKRANPEVAKAENTVTSSRIRWQHFINSAPSLR